MELENTEEIYLGSFLEADFKVIHSWQNSIIDARLTMGYRFPVSDVTSKKWLEERLKELPKFPDKIYWAIRIKSNERLIGFVTLYNIDYLNKNAEIGIYLATDRSKGFGKSSLKKCFEIGFADLNLHKIYAKVVSDNIYATRAFTAIGFKEEAVLIDQFWNGKHWVSIKVLSIFQP
jgi:RimJ/RimL family protein N-acetyltransferase